MVIFPFSNVQYVFSLRIQGNPRNAWRDPTSRRATALNSKKHELHCKPKAPTDTLELAYQHSAKPKLNPCYLLKHTKLIALCSTLTPGQMAGSSRSTRSNGRSHSSSHAPEEVEMEDAMNNSKRNSPDSNKSAHKKAKATGSPLLPNYDPIKMEFWYG